MPIKPLAASLVTLDHPERWPTQFFCCAYPKHSGRIYIKLVPTLLSITHPIVGISKGNTKREPVYPTGGISD